MKKVQNKYFDWIVMILILAIAVTMTISYQNMNKFGNMPCSKITEQYIDTALREIIQDGTVTFKTIPLNITNISEGRKDIVKTCKVDVTHKYNTLDEAEVVISGLRQEISPTYIDDYVEIMNLLKDAQYYIEVKPGGEVSTFMKIR